MPLFSIIIPFYNSSQYLPELVKLFGTLKYSHEVIIVNDASTIEETKKLVDITQKYGWKLIHQKTNQGPGTARNIGIQNAQGAYIVFLDADDLLEIQLFTKLNTIIETHSPEVILFNITAQTTKKTINYAMLPNSTEGLVSTDYAFAYCRSGTAGKCYNRNFLLKHHIQFGTLKRHEDTAFTKSALSLANKVFYLPESYYLYRMVNSSLITNKSYNSFNSSFAAYKIIHKKAPTSRKEALEYVYINEVIISCMTKILSLHVTRKDFKELTKTFQNTHPNWIHNKYLQKASLRYKLIAYLTYYQQYTLLKMCIRLETIVGKLLGVR